MFSFGLAQHPLLLGSQSPTKRYSGRTDFDLVDAIGGAVGLWVSTFLLLKPELRSLEETLQCALPIDLC